MELKFKDYWNEQHDKSSNCTFMELKFWFVLCLLVGALGSNRTFMELKFKRQFPVLTCEVVLIVPLWN